MSVWIFFKNSCWPALTDISVPEVNKAPAQRTYNNGYPPRADGRKCYKCGGNHIFPDSPRLQQANSRGHGGCGGDVRGGHGHGRVNGDSGGSCHGDIRNRTHDRSDGNSKLMVSWKYIYPLNENTVVGIAGTTWKFCKKCVCYVMGKAGFYDYSHTTS